MNIPELDVFGAAARLHHVGLVVASIAEAHPGLDSVHDPRQRVNIAFVDLNGVRFELLEPAGDKSPVRQSLEKNSKLVHLCYEVPDLEGALARCREFGFRCLQRPVPAVAFEGRRIAWVFSTTFGLVELVELTAPA